MPKAEQTLLSYLSPDSALSLKAPTLPSKPLRTTAALVGKAYAAAGQGGECLHTMGILQAYQADLLKELDELERPYSDEVRGALLEPLICLYRLPRRRPWKPQRDIFVSIYLTPKKETSPSC